MFLVVPLPLSLLLLAIVLRVLRIGRGARVVCFLHPDLGLGGAERLVVDAALGLQAKGYTVYMYTTFHDPARCFPETRDGTLRVIVVGDRLPRHILGRMHVLCVTLRMLWAALYMAVCGPFMVQCYIVDQLSTPVPLLRALGGKVLFYCHFPDQLCDPSAGLGSRRSALHIAYRLVFNTIEGMTMWCANRVVFNSNFTRETTFATFPPLAKYPTDVLYPPINAQSLDDGGVPPATTVRGLGTATAILSINRFESKKNIELAIDAFERLVTQHYDRNMHSDVGLPSNVHLFLAGGYDARLEDNKTYMAKLQAMVAAKNLSSLVTFLPSVPQVDKIALLTHCSIVLYTPTMEHFGIVPVEAMYFAKPVIAVNRCGPLESISVDNVYGRLVDPTPEAFCAAMVALLKDADVRLRMGTLARQRCLSTFTLPAFTEQIIAVMAKM